MALFNKSLGSLYYAISGSSRGASSVSLSGIAGGGSDISVSDLSFDSASASLPFTYIVENTTENLVFSFTSAGTRFGTKIKDKTHNYSFSIFPSDGAITYGTNAGGTDGVKASTTKIAVTTISNGVYAGGTQAYTLAATYNDGGWSQYQDGFNRTYSKTIYNVDAYNSINADSLCVSINTEILLADGNKVLASDLYVGDVIKTYVPTNMPEWMPDNDPENWYWWYQTGSSGEMVDATISNVYYSFVDSYISINNGEIECTKAHPLFIFDFETNTYQFVRAEDVTNGDKLIKYNNESHQMEEIAVTNIEIKNEALEIATITVDVAHTYLANGFVSHNKGSNTIAPIPSNSLICYMDAERTESTGTAGQFKDLTGRATGFNLTGGYAAGVTGPTLGGTTPKGFTFASGKYGIKQSAYTTSDQNGYNLSLFNSTTGYSIIAFVNASAGNIFTKGSDFGLSATGTTISVSSTPHGAASATSQTLSGWRMIGVTSGQGTTKIYNNNVEASSTTTTSASIAASTDMYLMQNNTGNLACLLYYTRVLSATEVGYIWNNLKGRFGL
jgi:hypothetical protein